MSLGDRHEVCWRFVRSNFFGGGVFCLVSFSLQTEGRNVDRFFELTDVAKTT